MPPKRKSFLDQLEREMPAPQPDGEQAAAPVSAPANNNPKTSGRPGIKKSSLYLADPIMDRLREIAFTERRKLHDLFLEGIDHVLASRGHAERTTSGD